MVSNHFPLLVWKLISQVRVSSMIWVLVTDEEGDYELYEEEYNSINGEPTCSYSYSLIYKDEGYYCGPIYDEYIRNYPPMSIFVRG